MDSLSPFSVANRGSLCAPLVISIPHAGRAYPPECGAMTRVPLERLMRLEDRFADTLAKGCIRAGMRVITAQTPRLWIDLNRAESDFDPQMMLPPLPAVPFTSQKVRQGLGLVPARLSGVGDIWREKLSQTDLAARIEHVHRPYHAAVADSLNEAQRRFGCAVLLDVHSMPPIKGDDAPDVVIGDRFGRTADARISDCARAVCENAGLRVAINTPYAGGYVLERHGRPHANIHAVQIEFDRRLYLDTAQEQPSARCAQIQALVATLAHALVKELGTTRFAEAAE